MRKKLFTIGRHSLGFWVDNLTGDMGLVTGYDDKPHIIISVDVSTNKTRKNRQLFDLVEKHLWGFGDEI